MSKKARKAVLLGMLLLFLIILIIAGIVTKSTPNSTDTLQYLSGWEIGKHEEKLPDSYYPEETQSYVLTMTHPLTEEMQGKVISFRTNDSFVDASIRQDGEATSIYHFGEKLRFSESPGTYTHFIKLPDSGSGEVVVRIETAYKNKFLDHYDIAIGEKNALIFGYLRGEAASIGFNLLLIVFGMMLLSVYIVSVCMRSPIPEALSLSAMTIVFTIYTNCPLFANQYIFQNAVTQYYLNYFTLFLLPLLLMLYLEDIVPGLKMQWLFYAFVALASVLTVLHFTGIASFTRTIKIFSGSLGLFALIAVVMIARHFKKMSLLNKIALLTLLFFLFINVLFFIFVSTLGNQSLLSKIGMLLYIALAIVNGLHKIMKEMFKEREDELLHEIAYTDNLTKLGNRYALERDSQKLPLENVSIVSLDLNYLKYTNDTFGHAAGDVLLKSAADCMASVFEKVYRVGGDEFIALLGDADAEVLETLQKNLQEKVVQFNRERTHFGTFADHDDFVLSIATGCASYESKDNSYEQIMNRADESMYQRKKIMHAERALPTA